jgi:hypothetical protein
MSESDKRFVVFTGPSGLDLAPGRYLAERGRGWARAVSRMVRVGGSLSIRSDGPAQVGISLGIGLREIGFGCPVLNPWRVRNARFDVGVVLASFSGLRAAIHMKQAGRIRRLLAGPNICLDPRELLAVPGINEIDGYLLPCDWAREYWLERGAELPFPAFVWAAGVDLPAPVTAPRDLETLILVKRNGFDIPGLKRMMDEFGSSEVLTYGSFARADFLSRLNRSRRLVYIGASESQGIALFEAWSRDVPTFVLRCDRTELLGSSYRCSAAPYLSEATGAFFSDLGELRDLVAQQGAAGAYAPRAWVAKHATHAHSARALVEISTRI